MQETTITVTVQETVDDTAKFSYSAQPATWEIQWVAPLGQINVPNTANRIRIRLGPESEYQFVGIRIVLEPSHLGSAPIHSSGPVACTPFTVETDSAQKVLTLSEGEANWVGWKTFYYSVGITNRSGKIFWTDPKIYNKGDS